MATLDLIDPLELSRAVGPHYHNVSLGPVNDHELRLSVMRAPFGWHRHPDSDETFVCVDGELLIEFEDRTIALQPGQLVTVPAGVVHRTSPAGERSVNLTFERRNATTVFEHDDGGPIAWPAARIDDRSCVSRSVPPQIVARLQELGG